MRINIHFYTIMTETTNKFIIHYLFIHDKSISLLAI